MNIQFAGFHPIVSTLDLKLIAFAETKEVGVAILGGIKGSGLRWHRKGVVANRFEK